MAALIDSAPCVKCGELAPYDLGANTNLSLTRAHGRITVTSGASSDNTISLPDADTVKGKIYLIYFKTDGGKNVVINCYSGDTFSVDGEVTATKCTMYDATACLMIESVGANLWNVTQDDLCEFTI